MANRNFPASRVFGMHLMPIDLDAVISIGASGAPTIVSAPGINSITRLSAGVYQVQLQDNYPAFLHLEAAFQSPVSGSNVNDGSFSAGVIYQITAVGTTNWAAAGLPAGITPAVGAVFKAANVGGAGSGTAKVLGSSGAATVELIGNQNIMLNNQPFQNPAGGYITFQCLAATSSSVTTLIPTDPANGSVMYLRIKLNNSSVQ